MQSFASQPHLHPGATNHFFLPPSADFSVWLHVLNNKPLFFGFFSFFGGGVLVLVLFLFFSVLGPIGSPWRSQGFKPLALLPGSLPISHSPTGGLQSVTGLEVLFEFTQACFPPSPAPLFSLSLLCWTQLLYFQVPFASQISSFPNNRECNDREENAEAGDLGLIPTSTVCKLLSSSLPQSSHLVNGYKVVAEN